MNDTLEQTKILESLAGIYGFEERIEEKLQIEKTLCELSEQLNNSKKTVYYLNQLANTYGVNGQDRNALKTQEKALIFVSENDSNERYDTYIRLSELYMLNDRETDAILSLHKANGIALSSENSTKIISSSKIIADFYKQRGEWEKAHSYLSVSDSISRALLETKIRKLENRSNTQSDLSQVDAKSSFLSQSEYDWLFSAWRKTIIALSCSVLLILILVLFYFRKRKKIRRLLEWKVYKRTKELRDLNAELNTYIYKSSHDLRNPLTSIKSLITLLKKETNPDQLEKYTTLIENCANQMDEILLNLSRAVDYKKLEPKIEQIDFSEIKTKLDLSYVESLPEGISLSWNIREKAPFFSDPNLINVILKKTILNSIQYRHGSSSDFCKISITTDSSGAAVCIEDNGQGIAEKVKDSVFDMFVKGTHKSKGAGLGLYLVKIASDKIRGKISLESEENKGSKLIFQLPNLA